MNTFTDRDDNQRGPGRANPYRRRSAARLHQALNGLLPAPLHARLCAPLRAPLRARLRPRLRAPLRARLRASRSARLHALPLAPLVAVLLAGLLGVRPGLADGMSSPTVGAHIVLQLETFHDGEDSPLDPSTGQSDRITVREAMLALSGRLGSRVAYDLEAGASQCPASGSGGPEVLVHDATIFYSLTPNLRVGMLMGHVLKGFMLNEECTDGLTGEKTRFAPVFSPCHPTGVAAEFEVGLGGASALSGQATHMNGTDLTLEEEHDANLGLVFHAPIEGLSLGGFYNHTRINLGTFDPATYESIYGDGYRAGLGLDFTRAGLSFRSEYYLGRAFTQGAGGAPEIENPEEREMAAFYAQTGFAVPTGLASIPWVEPYVRFQYWDQTADLDDRHEWTFWTVGVRLHLIEDASFLRLEYEAVDSRPSGTLRPADRLILRLQLSA